MSNAETSAVYAQEIMRLERENAAMTAERDKCSTGWDTALDITAKYLKRAEQAEAENATLREQLKKVNKDRLESHIRWDAENAARMQAEAEIATLREALSRLVEVHDAMGGMCSPERILAEEALAKEKGK